MSNTLILQNFMKIYYKMLNTLILQNFMKLTIKIINTLILQNFMKLTIKCQTLYFVKLCEIINKMQNTLFF